MNSSVDSNLAKLSEGSFESPTGDSPSGGIFRWIRNTLRPEEALLVITFALVFGWLLLIHATGLGDMSLYLSPRKLAGLLKWYLVENSLFLPIAFGLIIVKKCFDMVSNPAISAPQDKVVGFKSRLYAGTQVARDFLPFALVIAVYWIATQATKAFVMWEADPAMLNLEEMTMGSHVFITFRVWLDASFINSAFQLIGSTVNEFLVMSYGSYYLTPALLAALLYICNRKPLFRRFMLSLILASMIGYILYNLVPVRGPKYFFPEIYAAYFIPVLELPENSTVMGQISELTRLTCDCFPSLHTAWTLLNFVVLYHFSKWLFAIYLPIGIGVITATVYLGEHYVPDLAAGALVAIVAWILSRKIERSWLPADRN